MTTPAQLPLKDAAVNSTQWKLFETLRTRGLPVRIGSGGRQKFNRVQLDLPQTPQARCSKLPDRQNSQNAAERALQAKSTGQGERRLCRPGKLGFPGSSPRKFYKID